MSDRHGVFDPYLRQAGALHARVLSRDDMQLAPRLISRAAARRLKSGLRALEAYLRRVLLLIALQMEPGLIPDETTPVAGPRPRRFRLSRSDLRIFPSAREWSGTEPFAPGRRGFAPRGLAVPAAPYLSRLAALGRLIDAPEARARRLAWVLARRRVGLVRAPGRGPGDVPLRYGTEVSALYRALAPAILNASRARPPPLGPKPKPPPRIRVL